MAASSSSSVIAVSPTQRRNFGFLKDLREALLQLETLPEATAETRFKNGLLALGRAAGWQQALAAAQASPEERERLLQEVEYRLQELQEILALDVDVAADRFVALMNLRHLLSNYQRYNETEAGRRVLQRQLLQQLTQIEMHEPERIAALLMESAPYRESTLATIDTNLDNWRLRNQELLARRLGGVTPALAEEYRADLIAGATPSAEIQTLLLNPQNIAKMAELLGFALAPDRVTLKDFLMDFNQLEYTPSCDEYMKPHLCLIKAAAYGDKQGFADLREDPDVVDVDLAVAMQKAIPVQNLGPRNPKYDIRPPGDRDIFYQLYDDEKVQAVITAAYNLREFYIPESRRQEYKSPYLFHLGTYLTAAIGAANYEMFELFHQDPRLTPFDIMLAIDEVEPTADPELLQQLYDTEMGRFKIGDVVNEGRIHLPAGQLAALKGLAKENPDLLLSEAALQLHIDLNALNQQHPLFDSRILRSALQRLRFKQARSPVSAELISKILSFQGPGRQVPIRAIDDNVLFLIKKNRADLVEPFLDYGIAEFQRKWLAAAEAEPEPNLQIVEMLKAKLAVPAVRLGRYPNRFGEMERPAVARRLFP